MKKIVFALALITLPASALAMNTPPKTAEIDKAKAQEVAAERVVPAAELKALTTRWNSVSVARNTGPVAESNATDDLSKSTWGYVNGANTARSKLDRAGFDRNVAAANTGMDKMCEVLSGC